MDTAKLIDVIHKNGYTRKDVAKRLGICTKTLQRRLEKGDFWNSEIEILLDMLTFQDNPLEIFLDGKVKELPQMSNLSSKLDD